MTDDLTPDTGHLPDQAKTEPDTENLATAIRRRFAPFGRRFAPFGGVDALELPPRERDREPPQFGFDETLAEVCSKFADMSPEALESLCDEAVAAVRHANTPKAK
jgi:hypothetical protein